MEDENNVDKKVLETGKSEENSLWEEVNKFYFDMLSSKRQRAIEPETSEA